MEQISSFDISISKDTTKKIESYNPLDPYQNEILAEAIRTAVHITAQFETSYGTDISNAYSCVAGNFDGQGMAFGIIQYNFGQGTLQPILTEMMSQAPDVMEEIFNSDYAFFKEILGKTKKEIVHWADTISTKNKTTLISPWKEYFSSLGRNPVCQSIQQKHLETYWHRAIDPICINYGLKTCRGYALAFDIAVNLWALGNDAYKQIMAQVTDSTTETDLLKLMASYGPASTRPRREAIANGYGTVNGTVFDLSKDYGLSDIPFR